jgi:uncharacterized protein
MDRSPLRSFGRSRHSLKGLRTGIRLRLLTLMTLMTLGPVACAGEGGDGAPPSMSAESSGEGVQARIPPRGLAWVVFGSDTVRAELARTDQERARGLMERESLPDGTGMLFIFPDVAPRSFWMQNTYIPLDIAFMDADGVIVDIQAMEPLDETFTESAAPAMFALEVPQGWFAARGIGVGERATMVFGAS